MPFYEVTLTRLRKEVLPVAVEAPSVEGAAQVAIQQCQAGSYDVERWVVGEDAEAKSVTAGSIIEITPDGMLKLFIVTVHLTNGAAERLLLVRADHLDDVVRSVQKQMTAAKLGIGYWGIKSIVQLPAAGQTISVIDLADLHNDAEHMLESGKL